MADVSVDPCLCIYDDVMQISGKAVDKLTVLIYSTLYLVLWLPPLTITKVTFVADDGKRELIGEEVEGKNNVNIQHVGGQLLIAEARSNVAGISTRQSAVREPMVSEIPGFYYDPEKKKYFKIDKEHPGPAVTRTQVKKQSHSVSILKCLWDRECNAMSLLSSRRKHLEKLAQQLKVKQTLKLVMFGSIPNVSVKTTEQIEPNLNHTRILALCGAGLNGQLVKLHSLQKDRSNNLEITPKMDMCMELVTGMAWSPHEQTSNFYTLSLLGNGPNWGETLLLKVNDADQQPYIMARFPVKGHSVWCSAWNRNPLYGHIIGIGGSKGAEVVDINARRVVTHFGTCSDILALEFSRRDPILYSGSRDGCVSREDTRVRDADWPSLCFMHGNLASITCIRLLDDENYLMTSTLNGQIKKWDVRNSRCVQEYRGHVNETKLSLPFFLDPTDTLLFAAGQDAATRIWSVHSGEFLHSIPSTDVTACSIPALYFAGEWGGRGGLPGLMYGTGDIMKFYTY